MDRLSCGEIVPNKVLSLAVCQPYYQIFKWNSSSCSPIYSCNYTGKNAISKMLVTWCKGTKREWAKWPSYSVIANHGTLRNKDSSYLCTYTQYICMYQHCINAAAMPAAMIWTWWPRFWRLLFLCLPDPGKQTQKYKQVIMFLCLRWTGTYGRLIKSLCHHHWSALQSNMAVAQEFFGLAAHMH